MRAASGEDGTADGGGERPIRLCGVSRAFGAREVLNGVDLELHDGELVALLGANGSGKTTLMKVLVGLLSPDAGTVEAPTGRDVGWVPQDGGVYHRLTVRENLELFARLLDLPGDPVAHAREAAATAGLGPWWDSLASDLSGGLRQRLNVAAGLLGNPRLMVLDEPTTGVDIVHRTAMFALLRAHAGAGHSILYSTHALEDAAAADRAVVLVDRGIAWQGPVSELARLAPDASAVLDVAPGSAEWESAAARALLAMWEHEPSHAAGAPGGGELA